MDVLHISTRERISKHNSFNNFTVQLTFNVRIQQNFDYTTTESNFPTPRGTSTISIQFFNNSAINNKFLTIFKMFCVVQT